MFLLAELAGPVASLPRRVYSSSIATCRGTGQFALQNYITMSTECMLSFIHAESTPDYLQLIIKYMNNDLPLF